MLAIDPDNRRFGFPPTDKVPFLKPYLNADVYKLNIKFDLALLTQLTNEIFAEHPPKFKQSHDKYCGIGLQSADGFDEYYDTMQDILDLKQRRPVSDLDFRRLNSAGVKFKFIFDHFQKLGVKLIRARLIVACPGHLHTPHYDWDFRIHIPITTNSNCFAIFGKENYHMAADGNAYLHNGYHCHTFTNAGPTDRIHLIAVVEGLTDLHLALDPPSEKNIITR